MKIVREHALAGRDYESVGELEAAFARWLPIRLAQVDRTHGEVIGVRGKLDRTALQPPPSSPGRSWSMTSTCAGSARTAWSPSKPSLCSLPAKQIRAGQTVELRALPGLATIHALDGTLLASHSRAIERGSWVVDPAPWDGLPDGHTRATVLELPTRPQREGTEREQPGSTSELLSHRRVVGHRHRGR